MDVSVRRPESGTATGPVLRVVDGSGLRLHERADPQRVSRLVDALARDGVLRNPPVVGTAGSDQDPPIVLDGANRVTALQEIGVPHIVVQVVPYWGPQVRLSTWAHGIRTEAAALRGRLAIDGIAVSLPHGVVEAERHLRNAQGVAAIIAPEGAVVVAPEARLIDDPSILGRVVALYAGDGDIERLDPSDLGPEAARFTVRRKTMVLFPPLSKADVVDLAARGAWLPAGVTRHLVTGRALRLNVPLTLLGGPEPMAVKQARLDAFVEARWQSHGVRHYAESTYLFDE